MGLFYAHQETKQAVILTIRPASYLSILILIAASITTNFLDYPQIDFYLGMLVFAAAIWYTVEAWPLIKANWSDEVYKKQGKHLLSFKNPLQYHIKK